MRHVLLFGVLYYGLLRRSDLSGEDKLLAQVAAAVADDESIDWQGVERRLAPSRDAKIADALKLIHSLGHRSSALTVRKIPWTLRLLSGIVALQVVCAVAGVLLGKPDAKLVPAFPVLLTTVVFGGAGMVLWRAGRRDSRAWWLAAFFLCIASASSLRFLRVAAVAFPGNPVVSLALAVLPETFLPLFLWKFIRDFPQVLRLDRWASLVDGALRFSAAVGVVLLVVNAITRLPVLGIPSDLIIPLAPLLRQPTSLYWPLLSFLCLPAPFVAWVRSRKADSVEQRRVRWFLAGVALGTVPLFGEVLAEAVFPSFAQWMSHPEARHWGAIVIYSLLLTIPLTTSYAVVAYRILSVRLILHNAARLALARGSLLALGLMPTLLLSWHLYEQRSKSIVSTLQQETVPALLALTASGWVLYAWRGVVLGSLQRLLIGYRKEPALVLAVFAREAQAARTAAELEDVVQQRLAELVSAEKAGLLLRDEDRDLYVPVGGDLPPLVASSSFARVVEASSSSVILSEDGDGSINSWLIGQDRHWISQVGAHLALALTSSKGNTIALLILGPTRSGLPYSRDEQKNIEAFAATVSIAVEQMHHRQLSTRGTVKTDLPAGECRQCGIVVLSPGCSCACGSTLTAAPLPYVLAGKFRIEAVLGQGGMGVVYRALDFELGRQVALKTLPRIGSEELVRLRREARSMAGFLHPNLALIFGVETWRGAPVVVLEYLAQGSLAARLRRGAMEPWEVIRLGADLAAALAVIHAKGMLHRDVKPSNIGFSSEGVPKLLDFGLAALMEDAKPAVWTDQGLMLPTPELRMTLTGCIVGTPLYMSPETLAGSKPLVTQDLWGLHLVLWEALAGRHPFGDMEVEKAIRALSKGDVPNVRKFRADCPVSLASLLECGLDPEPGQRLPTASDVLEAFRSIAA